MNIKKLKLTRTKLIFEQKLTKQISLQKMNSNKFMNIFENSSVDTQNGFKDFIYKNLWKVDGECISHEGHGKFCSILVEGNDIIEKLCSLEWSYNFFKRLDDGLIGNAIKVCLDDSERAEHKCTCEQTDGEFCVHCGIGEVYKCFICNEIVQAENNVHYTGDIIMDHGHNVGDITYEIMKNLISQSLTSENFSHKLFITKINYIPDEKLSSTCLMSIFKELPPDIQKSIKTNLFSKVWKITVDSKTYKENGHRCICELNGFLEGSTKNEIIKNIECNKGLNLIKICPWEKEPDWNKIKIKKICIYF